MIILKVIAYIFMFVLFVLMLRIANDIAGFMLVILVIMLLGMLVWGIEKGVL